MTTLENDETIQRYGILAIVYHRGPFSLDEIDRNLYWQGLCSLQQLPIRICGVHYCFDDYKIRQATKLFWYQLAPEDRSQYHMHEGEYTQRTRMILDYIPLIFYSTTTLRLTHRMYVQSHEIQDPSERGTYYR